MSRFLLATCLFLFAIAAMAGDSTANDDGAGNNAKPGKVAAVDTSHDDDAAVAAHPAATRTRSTTPRTVSPRWHSLLPGMIR